MGDKLIQKMKLYVYMCIPHEGGHSSWMKRLGLSDQRCFKNFNVFSPMHMQQMLTWTKLNGKRLHAWDLHLSHKSFQVTQGHMGKFPRHFDIGTEVFTDKLTLQCPLHPQGKAKFSLPAGGKLQTLIFFASYKSWFFQEKFGYRSTWDESLYTTKLGSVSAEMEREAARIAREIERVCPCFYVCFNGDNVLKLFAVVSVWIWFEFQWETHC